MNSVFLQCLLRKSFKVRDLLTEKQAGTWCYGVLYLCLLALFFFLSYGFANHYAESLSYVPSIVFAWEQHIPLLPWTIVPYWSIDLFYGLSLLLCWNRFELNRHALRLLTAQLISIGCFLAFPLMFSQQRPELQGFFGWCFDVLMGFDRPYNQAPSLHIVLLLILWDFYRRHVATSWRWLVHLWSMLIGISVLTTWQHHFIDLPTGLLVGALCLWLFPLQVKSPFASEPLQQRQSKHIKIAIFYAIPAIILLVLACWLRSWALWLFYPALSFALLSLAYALVRVHWLQKTPQGNLTPAAWILFLPYLFCAWINSRIWTQKHPENSLVLHLSQHGIMLELGRIPNQPQPNTQAWMDCCAELPVAAHTVYAQYVSLDLTVLEAQQLQQEVKVFEQLYQESQHHHIRHIVVFCALGYSHSSAILAAWILQKGWAEQTDQAIAMIQQARPWIVLKQQQILELKKFNHELK